MANGQPDYSNISPTNNEVFALTYNQGVGGWNRTGNITSPENIEELTLEEVNKVLSFIKTENIIGND